MGEKKKNNKRGIVILVLLLCVMFTCLGFFLGTFASKKDIMIPMVGEKNEDNKESVALDVDSLLVKKLYRMVNPYNTYNTLPYYNGVFVSEMKENAKMNFVYANLPLSAMMDAPENAQKELVLGEYTYKLGSTSLKADVVKDVYEELFGKMDSFSTNEDIYPTDFFCLLYHYNSSSNTYDEYFLENVCTMSSRTPDSFKIIKAEKVGDDIIIYDEEKISSSDGDKVEHLAYTFKYNKKTLMYYFYSRDNYYYENEENK